MQITGMLYGAQLLEHVEFPAAEVLGPGATGGRDSRPDRPAQADLHQAAVSRRRRQEGQGRPDRQGDAISRPRCKRRSGSISSSIATAMPSQRPMA